MYYIDFDNTLYETGKLTKDVLAGFATIISVDQNLDTEVVLNDIKTSFNSTTDNFMTLCKRLSTMYEVEFNLLYNKLMDIMVNNGKKYVFPDGIRFLKKLKKAGEPICILTYVANHKNLSQQALKLTGSGIFEFIDEVYNTTRYKFDLNLDFENSVFIDDSPRDLEGFYNKGARNIIRIKKPNNEKRTSKQLNIPEELPTYTSFDDIQIGSKNIETNTNVIDGRENF